MKTWERKGTNIEAFYITCMYDHRPESRASLQAPHACNLNACSIIRSVWKSKDRLHSGFSPSTISSSPPETMTKSFAADPWTGEHKMILGFDIGTTFSGLSYAYLFPQY